MTMIHNITIADILVTVERSPPMAGPIRNAVPNAAPINPMFFVFSSGLEMSDI